MATGLRSCAWWGAALAARFDRRLGFGTFIPRFGAARRAHRPLVSLAREQDGVARLGDLDRTADRRPAVDHDLKVAAGRLPGGAGLNVTGDLDRVLGQRIVGRDDEKV